MPKKVLRSFDVNKRMEVWATATINAKDFDDAVAQSKELKWNDFIVAADGVQIQDTTDLPGHGVQENWP